MYHNLMYGYFKVTRNQSLTVIVKIFFFSLAFMAFTRYVRLIFCFISFPLCLFGGVFSPPFWINLVGFALGISYTIVVVFFCSFSKYF